MLLTVPVIFTRRQLSEDVKLLSPSCTFSVKGSTFKGNNSKRKEFVPIAFFFRKRGKRSWTAVAPENVSISLKIVLKSVVHFSKYSIF